jgi:uncharacterized protein (DUF2267 family)
MPKERRSQSYAALRAVLHALRDRLTIAEAAHLAARLPMLIRGIYYHGWDLLRVPPRMKREVFLDRVQRDFPQETGRGYRDPRITSLSPWRSL